MKIGEELTPPLPPVASSLHNSNLSSHCSACFSPLPSFSFTATFSRNPPPHHVFFYYCSAACSALDSPLHFSSAESHLLHLSPPDSSDLRLSLRLLSLFQEDDSVAVAPKHVVTEDDDDDDDVLERIGGLMTNRERLLSTREESLRKFVQEDHEVDDDVLERIRSGAKAMAAARRMKRGGSGGEEEEEEKAELVLCTAVLCLVMTNAVEVQDKSGRSIGVAVYDTTFSWINHSCSPNACYHFSTRTEDDSGASRLRICPAAVDGRSEVVDKCARGLVVKGNLIFYLFVLFFKK